MAYLLGSKFCIESLRKDVQDLQEAASDVISRAGPVKSTSWKYPDKQALEVDIEDLLERHDYTDDEEDRQVSHIVLLELVIDRLILLLHAMSGYMDQIIAMSRQTGSAAQGPASNSIGLAVKKYWNKLVHTYTIMQQLQSDNKTKTRKIIDLENMAKKLGIEQDIVSRNRSALDLPLSPEALDLLSKSGLLETMTSPALKNKDISHDEYNKSTQTIETAFVPCESCHEVQKCLRQVGDNVTQLCQSEGMISSLVKYKNQVENLDWLSANDISRWTAEQNKDISRIQKHLRSLYETIDPLKSQLAEAQEKMKAAEEKASQCKKQMKLEQETMRAQQKQFQSKVEDVRKQSREELEEMERQKEEMASSRQQLQQQLQTLQRETEKQRECLQQLEYAKSELESKLVQSTGREERVKDLENKLEQLSQVLQDVNQELSSVNKELSKERAKAKSFNRHQESLQGKQEHLLERIDNLDCENGKLQDTVSELQDLQDQLQAERDKLQDALDRANENNHSLNTELKNQQKLLKQVEEEKRHLEASVRELEGEMTQLKQQLQEASERERLIIEYPDLNGPVNPDLQGTGDIAMDMENQVRANSIRIHVLEDQNASLRNTITKMLQNHSSLSHKVDSSPTQLWQDPQPSRIQSVDNDNRNESGELEDEVYTYQSPPTAPSRPPHKVLHNTFLVSPPPRSNKRPPSGSNQKSRPPSAHTRKSRPSSGQNSNQETSSISAYMKLKSAGVLNKPNSAEMRYLLDRGKHGYQIPEREYGTSTQPPEENYSPSSVVICSKCDKMFNSSRDLEIHKSYCFGGL